MALDQITPKRRWCGYCAKYTMLSLPEFNTHQLMCESYAVKAHKSNKKAGGDPYNETSGEQFEGGIK